MSLRSGKRWFNMDDTDLYDSIYASFLKHRKVETAEDKLFVHELTCEAMAGVREYISELEEAIAHQKSTIKRMREDF